MNTSLYDSDFNEWTQLVSERLRVERLSDVELEHVAQEIGGLGNRDRRELFSRMIARLIREMPKLHSRAVRKASEETGMPASTFTRNDISRLDHLLLSDWYPESLVQL